MVAPSSAGSTTLNGELGPAEGWPVPHDSGAT
jgi:hypothetical protein